MNKKNTIIAISVLALVVVFFAASSIYLRKVSFYGTIELKIEQNSVNAQCISPTNQELQLNKLESHNNTILSYKYKRFYKSITIVSKNELQNDLCVLKINGIETDCVLNKKSSKDGDYLYELQIHENYSFWDKIKDFIIFLLLRFKFHLITIVTLFTVLLGFIKRKTLINLIKNTCNYFKELSVGKRYFLQITMTLILILIAFFYFSGNKFSNSDLLNNEVLLSVGNDQYDYQTIGVNLTKNKTFPINGKINPDVDYKINNSGNNYNIESFTGIKAFNRFPAYSVFISIVYSISGVNPISIKLIQILILLIMSILIPVYMFKTWGNSGFWAGMIASPFIFTSLLPYSVVLLPDTLTSFINFLLIWLYTNLRNSTSYRNFISFSLLLGISFLLKASLVIIIPVIFIDIVIICYKKGLKKNLLKVVLSVFIFLICWVPYNIWSIHQYRKNLKNCDIILAEIDKPLSDVNLANINNLNVFGSIKPEFKNISISEIQTYKNDIEPFIIKTGYLPYSYLKSSTDQNAVALGYCKIASMSKKSFFMITLISNYGALECHNEYVSNDGLSNEWISDQNSFYRNDGLKDKPDFIRILNFYSQNPKQFFIITNSKLKSFQGQTKVPYWFVSIFILHLILLSKKTKLSLIIDILLIIILAISMFFSQMFIYLFICSIIFLLFRSLKKKDNSFPLTLIILNGVGYILVAYSSIRYNTYYIFSAYILAALMITISINKVFQKKENKSTDNFDVISNKD